MSMTEEEAAKRAWLRLGPWTDTSLAVRLRDIRDELLGTDMSAGEYNYCVDVLGKAAAALDRSARRQEELAGPGLP